MPTPRIARYGRSCSAATGAALLSLLALPLLPGCGSSSSETTVGPSPARCGVTATTNPSTFPAEGGSGTLTVSSARECSWSASSRADWISLAAPTDGQGDGTVRYTVAPNPVATARSGALVVGPETKEITQQPARCRFELSRRSFDLPPASGGGDIDVDAAAGCAWQATTAASWIDILDGARGSGPGRVRFRAAANPSVETRAASIEIAGLRVDVRQSGIECRYAIEPANAEAPPGGADGAIAVDAAAGCAWSAVSDEPWLTVTSGADGSGPGQVRYRAAGNGGPSARTGRITIGGLVFTLRQAGCTYAIDPSSADADPGETDGRIAVETPEGCSWSAESDASWLSVTGGSSGSGPGEVRYRAAANEGSSARTGRITVADRTFTLQQAACTYTISPESASFGAFGGDGEIDVRSPSPCGWSAEPSAAWIVIRSGGTGTGDGEVRYDVLPNLVDGARSGTIVIGGRTFTISQAGPFIEGAVRDVKGSCPTREFSIRSQPVRTNGATVYEGGRCRDLRNGVVVRVRGTIDGNGVLLAREVDF